MISFPRDRSSTRNTCQSTLVSQILSSFSWSDQYSVCLNSVPLNRLLVVGPLFQGISLVLGIPANLPCFSGFCWSWSWTDQYSVLLELCVFASSAGLNFLLEESNSCLKIDNCVRTARAINHVQSVIDFLLYLSSNTMSLCT